MKNEKTSKMTMDYKGYTADVEWDKESGHITGSVPKIRHLPEFTAASLPEVSREFKRVVDTHLAETDAARRRQSSEERNQNAEQDASTT